MARPTNQGIDYFPLDTQFDEKIELFLLEVGAEGLSVLITTWQLIYQNEGYYIKNNDDLYLLIKRRLMLDVEVSKLIISAAINRNIFDQEKNKAYKILTSSAVQKRYFIGAKKKKITKVDKNYLCNGVSGGENSVYSSGNATNVNVKEEVKVEVKEKTKSNRKPQKRFSPPTREELIQYCNEKQIAVNVDKFLNHYESNGWKVGKNKMKSWTATLSNWGIRNAEDKSKPTHGKSLSGNEQRAENKRVSDDWLEARRLDRESREQDGDALEGTCKPL